MDDNSSEIRRLNELFTSHWGKLMEALVDVDHFLQTLRHFHRLMPEYGDKLAYGAAAYLKADEGSAVHAEKQGLFVIRATGSSASITNRRDFRPRAFGGWSPAPASRGVESQ